MSSDLISEIRQKVEEAKRQLIKGSTMKPEYIAMIIADIKQALASLPEKAEDASNDTQENIRKLIIQITEQLEELRIIFVGKMKSFDPQFGHRT